MIQFNLLPDVKLEFIRTRRLKRSVMLISAIVGSAAGAVMIFLFIGVAILQKQHLNDLSNNIVSKSKELSDVKDLDKILTIQNQMNTLTSLHNEKHIASRLPQYLVTITPPNATYASINVDFTSQTVILTGAADKISTVNQLVDTIKFASYGYGPVRGNWANDSSYKVDEMVTHDNAIYTAVNDHTATKDTEPGVGSSWQSSWKLAPRAFSEVVLTSFGRDDKGSSYTITTKYDPAIFDGTKEVTMTIPNIITTRSITEKPDLSFQPLSNPQGKQ